jgi:hypothetical protein
MKIKDTSNLVGRTIQAWNKQYWLVEGIFENEVSLSCGVSHAKGKLKVSDLARCKLYPTMDEVEKRYPRLIHIMKHTCSLTQGEAVSAVHGYITAGPFFYGSEAVARIGGSTFAINHAFSRRKYVNTNI